ncbi:4'-phosphopantetheinyl transferase family protein [Candidatus Rariloculus sp.]|uniref:4'-phosphopantetheinyl transferase family protein n=1 Tax=Candidatus Rariloculus sp. TaxID=3101265 RepID=UPI003D09D8D2
MQHGDGGHTQVRVYLLNMRDADAYAPGSLPDSGQLDLRAHPRRRQQFLAGRALVRFAIERSAGIPPAEQRIQTLPGGKPVCIGGPAISLSHSLDWVACAVASRGVVGVDLQFPVTHIDARAVAASYFPESECQWIGGDRNRFFMLWTLKEAHLKAVGLGISGGLDSVSCRIDPPRINARFNRTEPTHLSLHAFRDAVVAVATTVRFYDDVDVSVLGPDGPDKAMSRAAKSIAST